MAVGGIAFYCPHCQAETERDPDIVTNACSRCGHEYPQANWETPT